MTKEDLMATGKINTTIVGLDLFAPDWVEQAAEKVDAVKGTTYVQLNRGILTVDQIDALLDSIPLEFSFIDANNQFVYYNNDKPASEMIAPSKPESVGQPLGTLHPKMITTMVQRIAGQLRSGALDIFRIGHPRKNGSQYVTHNYKRIQDKDGNYMGINEYVQDLKPLVDYYLKETGQKLVPNNQAPAKPMMPPVDIDAFSGASEKTDDSEQEITADAMSHATSKP